MRKLLGALAAILVLILAEDLHAMPLGGAVGNAVRCEAKLITVLLAVRR